jgi:ribosome-binding factor A
VPKDRLAVIESEFRKVLSEIINEMKDPRISGMSSVTRVELTRDLSYAKAYISIFGDEKSKKSTIETLTHAEHFIKNEIGARIKLRRLPELKFINDTSMEYSSHIADLLKKV